MLVAKGYSLTVLTIGLIAALVFGIAGLVIGLEVFSLTLVTNHRMSNDGENTSNQSEKTVDVRRELHSVQRMDGADQAGNKPPA